MQPNESIEQRIQTLGRAVLHETQSGSSKAHQLRDAFLNKLLADRTLKTQILRLVDVLPVLRDDRKLAEHLDIYLGSQTLPLPWPGLAKWGLHHARSGLPAHIIAAAARKICRKMALNFLAGETVEQVETVLYRMWRRGLAFSLDLLGEASTGESVCLACQNAYLTLIPELHRRLRLWPHRSSAPPGIAMPQLHFSIKASALYSQIHPVNDAGSVHAVKNRLRPVLAACAAADGWLIVDMEQFDFRAITLRVFRELLEENDFRHYTHVGIAVQAYQTDAPEILARLIAWAKHRGSPVTIRLVRGAYWDYEQMLARQHDWTSPVWQTKAQTDACYQQCLEMLLANYPHVRTAVATHNLRSVCSAAILAESYGLKPADFEFQMLYGMAEDFALSMAARGYTVRLYTPFGPLLPGMAYLVRRLMENSSNESFLKRIGTGAAPDQILAPPQTENITPAAGTVGHAAEFVNLSPRRFSLKDRQTDFAAAVARVQSAKPLKVSPFIAGKWVDRTASTMSINPSHKTDIVGIVSEALPADVDAAVSAAARAAEKWRGETVENRAVLLEKAAAILESQRDELAAWEIREAGKLWQEADADVCEAIDHIRYCAFQARRLFAPRNLGVAGESNVYEYRGVGPTAVITPWNFPLAIPAGMSAAALAAGNPIILKPAPQTPVMALFLQQAFQKAGIPDDCVGLLPGGGAIGRALVEHRDTAIIAFTGSEAAGRAIMSTAAGGSGGTRHIKRVIAEMGGKNAIIVDDDADLDQAIADIAASAFSYAGQKCSACSRLIVLDAVYDELLKKLVDAAASLIIGNAADPAVVVGPVIDQAAQNRINQVVEQARSYSRRIFCAKVPPGLEGFFVPPAIFTDVPPESPLAQDEIFGPVLALFRVETIKQAVDLANACRFGLTGGLMSRNPQNIDYVRRRLEVGNLYINRGITGAVVGRQPFGGMKSSGVGSKAGGPDYLLQFSQARVVTENAVRHGFIPPENT